MNLLYLSFWGLQDGLTTSTILPHLRILQTFENIKNITVCTIERDGHQPHIPSGYDNKVDFIPLIKKQYKSAYVSKMTEFIELPRLLEKICSNKNITHILARGVNAGGIALNLHKKRGIPFTVESFEPHSNYMVESKAWKKNGLKFLFGNKWEAQQRILSKNIITVSDNYRRKLIEEGVNAEKIFTIPCCVDTAQFAFNTEKRKFIRKQLHIPENALASIYVGKFGEIYYKEEAYDLIKQSFEIYGDNYHTIILTPQSKDTIRTELSERNIPLDRVRIDLVPHHTIPDYLSAADFAFSFHRSNAFSGAFSPVKNGEYWANGLPIIIAENIGDDSEIVKRHHIGEIFNPQALHKSQHLFNSIKKFVVEAGLGKRNPEVLVVANRYRNYAIAREVYSHLFE